MLKWIIRILRIFIILIINAWPKGKKPAVKFHFFALKSCYYIRYLGVVILSTLVKTYSNLAKRALFGSGGYSIAEFQWIQGDAPGKTQVLKL